MAVINNLGRISVGGIEARRYLSLDLGEMDRNHSIRDESDDEDLVTGVEARPVAHQEHHEGRVDVVTAGKDRIIDYGAFHKLKGEQRDKLVQDVNEGTEMDNLRLMEKVKARFETAGLRVPRVEVRFINLKVERDVYVGDRALPTLINEARAIVEGLMKAVGIRTAPTRVLTQLDGVTGAFKPGRFTLLLGPPGSGKTTLLRALAGQLKEKGLRVTGDVRFNGQSSDSFCIERAAAYIDQKDRHLAVQTVHETLAFSARCMGVSSKTGSQRYRRLVTKEAQMGLTPDASLAQLMHNVFSQRKGSNIMVEVVTRLLGLDTCVDTVIGNDMVKGISGGQKRRVTSGEMLVNNFKVMLMDEISTGLDSASTQLITAALRNISHFLQATVVVALLQPSPETYELFDDILLMSDSRIVFHGPRESILPFFETLHLVCPPHKAHADFLQEVTSPRDQGYYWSSKTGEKYKPLSTRQLSEAFYANELGRQALAAADAPWDIAPEDVEDGVLPPKKFKYGLTRVQCLLTCLGREWLLTARNLPFVVIKVSQTLFMAFITSTLFLRMSRNDINDGLLFMSVIFYSVLFMFLNGFSEIPGLVDSLPVFYKQRDYRFYPAWSYAIASALCRVPQNVLEATCWTVMVYWSCGYTPQAGQFFVFLLILNLTNFMSTALFRMLATITRNPTTANALGALVLLMTVNSCGFTISKPSIPGWWIWVYWANPLTFIIRALLVNEFTSESWTQLTEFPAGSGKTMSLGRAVLLFRGYQDEFWWVWIAVGYSILATLACVLGQAIFLTIFDELRTTSSVPDPEPEDKMLADANHAQQSNTHVQPSNSHARDVELGHAGGTHAISGLATAGYDNAARDGHAGVQGSHVHMQLEPAQSTSAAAPAGHWSEGSALSFAPLVLSFKDIKYAVPKPGGKQGEQLQLLKGITGCFRPGVLTALMGASGAGKTTLMDVLAGRKTGGIIQGSISVNGHPKDQSTFARVMGYVEQFDIHNPYATVLEALTFSAQMRLQQGMDNAAIAQAVKEVMDLVELHPIANSVVGHSGSGGLSTEQRKRLTIAVELVANPAIVFMDEPTSGLDARAAAIVMRTVRNTVNTGRTVVCTIHQPSLDIFQAFDELLLLKRGGETIFCGDMGPDQRDLINHFEAVRGVDRFKPGYNPANWMLEVSSPGNEAKLGVDFARIYEDSALSKQTSALVDEVSKPKAGTQPLHFPAPFAQGWLKQLRLLLARNFTSYWRNPYYNLVRFVITIIVAICFGTLYYKQGNKRDVTGVLNMMGALYSSYIFMGSVAAFTVLPVISEDRVVFYRERAAGMYFASAYSVAQGLVEIPYQIVESILYVGIIYFMIDFVHDAAKFFWFLLFFFQCLTVLTAFGIMCVNLTPAVVLGTVMCNFFFSAWNLFCGFLIQKPVFPGGWVWMYYLTPITWILYGGIGTQVGDSRTTLTSIEGTEQTVSQFVEQFYSYKYNMRGWCVLILFAFYFLFRGVSTLALMKFNFARR